MSDSPNGILPQGFEKAFIRLLQPLSRWLLHIGFSPNSVTLLSLAFGLIGGVFIASDHLHIALLFGILMGLCDILDGQLAKYAHAESRFGAILDSVVDRYNELFILSGLAVRYFVLQLPLGIFLVIFAMAGSVMVSYVKARGEGVGLRCCIGLMQRAERLVLLAVGVVFGGFVLDASLLLLAVMAHFTVLQRVLYLKKNIANIDIEISVSESKLIVN